MSGSTFLEDQFGLQMGGRGGQGSGSGRHDGGTCLSKTVGLKKREEIRAVGKRPNGTSGPAGYDGEGWGWSLSPMTRRTVKW